VTASPVSGPNPAIENRSPEPSLLTYARAAGVLYLVVFVCGIFSEAVVRSRLVADLVMVACFAPAIIAELATILWLLIRGVDVGRCERRGCATSPEWA
jgi:hypothetical protein